VHTIDQVKGLLSAAGAIPQTTLLSYGPEDEDRYRRAVDVLDSLGMIGAGEWHPAAEDGSVAFEVCRVVDPETGDQILSLYGPVKCLASVEPMRRLAAIVLGGDDTDAA
jgi:hypothetical protein